MQDITLQHDTVAAYEGGRVKTAILGTLRLGPGDLVIVKDQETAARLSGIECNCGDENCLGHEIVVAPDGLEKVSKAEVIEILRRIAVRIQL